MPRSFNEKTPSFTVSPVKGIFKCFGCGKAGNAVGFIMEHEHLTYPEALRYLAKKYQIEIGEEEQTPEQIQEAGEMLQKAQVLIPDNPSVQAHMATFYEKNGNVKKAAEIAGNLLAHPVGLSPMELEDLRRISRLAGGH